MPAPLPINPLLPQMSTDAPTATTTHPRKSAVSQALAETLRREDYDSAQHVLVDLRAEDPAGEELQIWRTQIKPSHRIRSGMLVSLWRSETSEAVGVLRRVMGVRSIEEHWVEFILEPYNPFPQHPDPKARLTIYLAVPIKWAKLHRKTKTLRDLAKAARHLYNTYTIAPEALQHIRQTEVHYWTTRGNGTPPPGPSPHKRN